MHLSCYYIFLLLNVVLGSKFFIKKYSLTIVGLRLKTIYHSNEYGAFYRIPYAEQPVGELRFKAPKELKTFDKNKTYEFSKLYRDTSFINENCLHLTIFTPILNSQSQYFPILVWPQESVSQYGPDFFIDEEVLVVIVNFRSSIFGFLNTEDDFAEGNMGAKDILLALKWLLDNISIFNGDPTRITIMGSGEATTSVASMLLTRVAGTLFQRAIIMDGSALSPADYRPYNFEVANKLFWKFNGSWDQFNRKELYNILKNSSAAKLKLASRKLYDSTEVRDKQRLINAFSCTVENNSGERAFMTKSPVDVYRGKNVSKINVIFGYTTFPSLFKLDGISKNRKLLKYLNYNFQYLLPFEGECDEYGSKRYRRIRKEIMDFYFINGTITDVSFKRYAKYISDQTIYPLLRQAVLQSKVSKGSVYLYRLPLNGPLNMRWRKFVPNLKWKGATSGDEICYLFKCKSELETYNRIGKVNETRFISRIVRLFGNFVKFGLPTPRGVDNIFGSFKWLPLEERRPIRALNMGHHLKMVNVPEEKRMLFWNQLRRKYFCNKNNKL